MNLFSVLPRSFSLAPLLRPRCCPSLINSQESTWRTSPALAPAQPGTNAVPALG